MNKQEFKTDRGTRIVFGNDKPDFNKNRSTVFHAPVVATAISQANPLESVGLGVHRTQVQEFNEMYRERGIVGAMHKEDGTLVLESRKARNDVLKTRGCRDNDAGYGDHGGNN